MNGHLYFLHNPVGCSVVVPLISLSGLGNGGYPYSLWLRLGVLAFTEYIDNDLC